MAISEALGEVCELDTPAGTIRYRERGTGPAVVFVHGAVANGDAWRKVVPLLADRYRCITPDWPLGAHDIPMAPDADLTPPGLARIMADFLDALDAGDVALVTNDTGTALAQLLFAHHDHPVSRAVLTQGAAFTHFFPPAFRPLSVLARIPGALRLMGLSMVTPSSKRIGYVPLSNSLRDGRIVDSYVEPARTSDAIRRDLRKFLRSVRPRYTLDAAPLLGRFDGPVLVVWGPGDRIFPSELGERLTAAFARSELLTISGTRTYIPEDQPEELAAAIASFLEATADDRPSPRA